MHSKKLSGNKGGLKELIVRTWSLFFLGAGGGAGCAERTRPLGVNS